jgi:alpha-galactosidase
MTTPEFQAQLSMWAILAAPYMLGNDVATLSDQVVKLLTNRAVIAIDQDRLGIQGREVSDNGTLSEWRKPLAGGAEAIAYLNAGSLPATVTAPKGTVEDVWTGHKPAHRTLIAPDSVLLLRVS